MIDYSTSDGIKHIDDGGHFYPTPFGVLPSITTVNAAMEDHGWLEDWRNRIGHDEAKRQSEKATHRGSLCHAYVEQMYQLDPTNPDSVLALQRTTKQLEAHHGLVGLTMADNLWKTARSGCVVPWAQEVALWSGDLMVAGRCDQVGEWHGVPSILDWKTSRRPKREDWIGGYYIQVAAYALMHNEMFGTDIHQGVIVITVQNSQPQIFVFDTRAWYDRVRARCADYHRLQWALVAA